MLANDDGAAVRARNRAAEEDEILIRTDLDDLEVGDGHALVTHAARHALTLEDAPRIGAVTDRPAVTEILVGAVRAGETAEVVALHHAGRAFALAYAGHVDDVARLEHVGNAHVLTDLQRGVVADRELTQHAERALLRLRDVPVHRLRHALLLLRAEAELHGRVTVTGAGLRLHHGARTRLHDRHRDEAALPREDLGHADLLADDPANHVEVAPPTAA